ncbi:MAG: Inositol transport system ATP-binding protein, partial [uncultured Rubrobacteraceae bacterium]
DAADRGRRHLQVFRPGHRAQGHLHERGCGRGPVPAWGQRGREEHPHKDPLGRPPPRRGQDACRGRRGKVQQPARRPRPRHRNRLPGPRDDPLDGHLAQLLSRPRADEGLRPVQALRRGPRRQGDARGDAGDGHRHPRPVPAGRHPLWRRAPVGCDSPRRPLRGQGPDPGRADERPRGKAGGGRSALHRQDPRAGHRRDLHNPQRPPRLPRGRPLHHPPPRPELRQLRQKRGDARGGRLDDGRRRRHGDPLGRARRVRANRRRTVPAPGRNARTTQRPRPGRGDARGGEVL